MEHQGSVPAVSPTIPSNLPEELKVTVNHLLMVYAAKLSPDNNTRRDAEARLKQFHSEDPSRFVMAALVILRTNPQQEARQTAAIDLKSLFKDYIVSSAADGSESVASIESGAKRFWNTLTLDAQNTVKAGFLECLESEESVTVVRNAVCDATAVLAKRLLADNLWPELQLRINALLASPNATCQVSGLQLLCKLILDAAMPVKEHIMSLCDILAALMQSESASVRYECCQLLSTIVETEGRPVWKHLQKLVPALLRSMSVAVLNPNEQEAAQFLFTLIDICDYDAGFFSNDLAELAQTCVATARNQQIPDRIQQLAVEILLTIAANKRKMVTKHPVVIVELLDVLMEFMLTVKDDADWEKNDAQDEEDEDDEDDGENASNYQIAESGFDRLAAYIGGEVVLPRLYNIIVQNLQSPASSWQMKLACLVAMAQTVEHIPPEEVDKYLEQIVPLSIAHLNDIHPRVRFAACQSLGQAATDAVPIIQENHSHEILAALIRVLDDPVIRVQSHAARALSNFCEDVETDDLTMYCDLLVEKLLLRVNQEQSKPLLSACVTTLAVVAGAADKYFVKYYTSVVPAMKNIVRQMSDPEDKVCREKALECITLVALAIGKEAIAADSAEIMEVILELWTTACDLQVNRNAESAVGEGPSETLSESLCRMCRVLGENFVQYLPVVMPRIFRILTQKPIEAQYDDFVDQEKQMILVALEDGKTVGMRSQIVMDIEQMATLLFTLTSSLGDNFQSWITQTVQHTLPLLSFTYCDKVMQNSLSIVAAALQVARKLADNETDPTTKSNYMQLIQSWMWTSVEKCFSAIDEGEIMIENTLELPKCAALLVKNAGSGLLTEEQVFGVSKKCLELLRAAVNRNEDVVKGREEEHDEDDEEDIQGEERYELEFAANVLVILSALIETHCDFFCANSAQAVVAFLQEQLQLATCPHHASVGGGLPLALSLYTICELVTIGDNAVTFWSPFTEALIEAVNSSDLAVRQAAAHGIKLIAKMSTQLSTDLVVRMTKVLLASLNKTDRMKTPLDENVQSATDNVVAAIGALTFQQSKHLIESNDPQLAPKVLLNVWLSHLPLKADFSEGQLVHGDLVKLVLQNNPEIMGVYMGNLPHLLKIFANIYKKPQSTDEINTDLQGIARTIGEKAVMDMELQLSKDEKKTLEKMFFDARSSLGSDDIVPGSPAGTTT